MNTIKPFFYLSSLSALLLIVLGCSTQKKTVLLTGYWPPSNEMLIPFSSDPQLNPDGWQGKNFNNTGYDVYAYFPQFPGGTKKNPKGNGDFEVDYQDTHADFKRLTRKLKPKIIISYGRGKGPWEIEVNASLPQKWGNDYSSPKQPTHQNCTAVMKTTLPVEKIKDAVKSELPDLDAWIDHDGNPGLFLCHYIAFLGMQYQSENDHCRAAGFIHVGSKVDLQTAKKANLATIKAAIQD